MGGVGSQRRVANIRGSASAHRCDDAIVVSPACPDNGLEQVKVAHVRRKHPAGQVTGLHDQLQLGAVRVDRAPGGLCPNYARTSRLLTVRPPEPEKGWTCC